MQASSVSTEHEKRQVGVLQLIAAYRNRGHQKAKLDPLGLMQREYVPDLELAAHGLSRADFDTVFQTGNLDAVNAEKQYPAIWSVVAKMCGSNHPSMPPYAAFMKSRSHLAFAGYLGKQYDPFLCDDAARLPIYTNVGVDTGAVTGGGFNLTATGITTSTTFNGNITNIGTLASGTTILGANVTITGTNATFGGQQAGNNVTINVNGGDPNAVVAALRTYMRQNGSVPIRVSNIF